MKFILIFLVFCSLSFSNDKWTNEDKILFGANILLDGLDIHSTQEAFKNGAYEANPIYGSKHPTLEKFIVVKSVAGFGKYLLIDNMSQSERGYALWLMNILTAGVITNNFNIAYNWNF